MSPRAIDESTRGLSGPPQAHEGAFPTVALWFPGAAYAQSLVGDNPLPVLEATIVFFAADPGDDRKWAEFDAVLPNGSIEHVRCKIARNYTIEADPATGVPRCVGFGDDLLRFYYDFASSAYKPSPGAFFRLPVIPPLQASAQDALYHLFDPSAQAKRNVRVGGSAARAPAHVHDLSCYDLPGECEACCGAQECHAPAETEPPPATAPSARLPLAAEGACPCGSGYAPRCPLCPGAP